MSSNRKRAAIRKAEGETDRLRQMLMLRDYHYNALKCISEVMAKRIEELEAELASLRGLAQDPKGKA
jgi:hypothetical protein